MTYDFNRDWQFSREGETPRVVHLPHDAMLAEPRKADCQNGERTGYFPGGKYRYEKTFPMDETHVGRYVALEFQGVYRHATVALNGQELAFHRYGYTEFTVDLSAHIQQGTNTVSVLVDNSLEPNSRWYTGSGIYQPVSLILRDKDHISNLTITTKSHAPAVVEIQADAQGATVEIYDGERLVTRGGLGETTIPDAKLWSAESPHLYRCVVRTPTDEVERLFGIRTIAWSARTGLLINGVRTLLRGGCLHHDNGILGACAFGDAELRRVRILKEAGYNAIRASHNPCTRALLEACDKLGLYVMDEAFDGWYTPKTHHDSARHFHEDYPDVLRAMVSRDKNHPSVILYSIGNEVTETAAPEGIALTGEMVALLHRLDPTRPVTCGLNAMLNWLTVKNLGLYKDTGPYKPEPLPPKTGATKEKKSGSAFFNLLKQKINWVTDVISGSRKAGAAIAQAAAKLDIVGLNYGSARYDKELRDNPNHLLVGSETLFADLPYNWARVKAHPALIGDFVWTAWDYLGEAGIGDWAYPSESGLPLTAGCGGIDLIGTIGAQCQFQQIVWGLRHQPYVGVRPVNHAKETPVAGRWRFTNAIDSWNWQGHEGERAVVEVFGDAHAIRLQLDGQTIATKRIKRYKTRFALRYRPGTLQAVALDREGQELASGVLVTGREKRLVATPDKTTLSANGQDLCFVEIGLTDEHGQVWPAQDTQVTVEVDGAGVLQGFGSGRSATDEVFGGNRHTTFQGRALAVIRAGYEPGEIQVVVSAEGHPEQRLTLEVVPCPIGHLRHSDA